MHWLFCFTEPSRSTNTETETFTCYTFSQPSEVWHETIQTMEVTVNAQMKCKHWLTAVAIPPGATASPENYIYKLVICTERTLSVWEWLLPNACFPSQPSHGCDTRFTCIQLLIVCSDWHNNETLLSNTSMDWLLIYHSPKRWMMTSRLSCSNAWLQM